MAIVDQNIADGPVISGADGTYRGAVDFTLDDGRVIRKQVKAIDAAGWSEALVDLAATVFAKVQEDDANAASETEQEIEVAPLGQATREHLALAYLRKAYSIGDPYRAFLKFDKFNTWRLSKGWNLNQVVAGLSGVGLTEEEWVDMRDRYVYLSNAARVTAMEAYQSILAGDTWGAENR